MADDLASYLREKGSPLADHVDSIYRAGNKYRIDPRLIVAISGGETSFGKAGGGPQYYNAWGIGPGRKYASWDQGIDAAAKLLRTGYVGQGLTSLQAIQRKWAPVGASNDPANLNSNWVRTNTQFYSDLGGDPANVTKNWRKMASPKQVEKRQRTAMPSVPSFSPMASSPLSSPLGGNPIQVALGNLGRIAAGEKPTSTLRDLVSASEEAALAPPPQGQPPPKAGPGAPQPQAAVTPASQGTPGKAPRKFRPTGQPVPKQLLVSIGSEHPTAGLEGYEARDYMAPAGAPAVAPVSGTVMKFSGHDPSRGPTEGVHGPFGWSMYIQGDDGHIYYLTHMGARTVKVGERVKGGEQIGTVGNYARWGGANHIHMGVH